MDGDLPASPEVDAAGGVKEAGELRQPILKPRCGAIAASSLRRSSESDTLECQQATLVVEPQRAVRAESVRGDDAVAGHDEWEAVPGAERSDRPLGARIAGELRQLRVRDDLPIGNGPQRPHDVELERRPAVDVDLDAPKVDTAPPEVHLHVVDELFRFRRGPVTDLCAFRRYRNRLRMRTAVVDATRPIRPAPAISAATFTIATAMLEMTLMMLFT